MYLNSKNYMKPKFGFILTRSDVKGGATVHVLDVSKRLIQSGFDVTVFLGGDGFVFEEYKMAGLSVVRLKLLKRDASPFTDLFSVLELTYKLFSHNITVVSAHTSKAGFISRIAAKTLGIPCIYTPHCFATQGNFTSGKLILYIEKLLSKITDYLVCVSMDEARHAIDVLGYYSSFPLTIHNGMPDCDVAKISQEHESGKVRLMTVARMEPQKDYSTLLKALSFCQDLPLEVVVVGDGPDKNNILELVENYGLGNQITFLRSNSNVIELLVQADLYLLISKWEGLPRSIIEALRAGLPIIASDVGGNRELVLSGENGFLVKKGDYADLSEKIRCLAMNRSAIEDFGKKSREHYLGKFTFEKMYQKYCKLYGLIIEKFYSEAEV